METNALLETGSDADFAVVGIGASAGGLKALTRFFEATRADSGMAFVVVIHLSAEHESSIASLLQKATAMPVAEVRRPVKIEANRVYVISPRHQLAMSDGSLVPIERTGHSHPMSIDLFFRTLGAAHGSKAIAIVLSGTGSDGTQGLREVKAQGGVTLVQTPSEAEYDGMPRNAIGGAAVDFVLSAREMPAKLVAIWDNARRIALPPVHDEASGSVAGRDADALRDILALVKVRTGHDFTHYKRSTLLRRLERRLQVNELRELSTYRDYLGDTAEETIELVRDLLINVTSFFRDTEIFRVIEERVIPAMIEQRDRRGGKLRVWVAGCATGEEAYSLAMLLIERLATVPSAPELALFATDISESALEVARAGLYPETIAENVSPERLQRFFTREPQGFRVQAHLRERIMFAAHNVLQDPPFSRLDLVSCRNLLIYVNRHAQSRILDLLHFALRPNGFLVLGSAETPDEAHEGFVAYDRKHRIYRQQSRSHFGFPLQARAPLHVEPPPEDVAPAPTWHLSQGELHRQMLELYAPPSVIVDERFDLVHVSGTAGRYLEIRGGEPTLNLLQIVPAQISLDLRRALDQAMRSAETVTRVVAGARGPRNGVLTLRVHGVVDKRSGRSYALVIFDESTAPAYDAEADAPAPDDRLAQLHERLEDTEALLRSAIHQYELRNEQLRASNEELQATNEELRATSEELETGKEELQSTNEELQTLNQELKNKVDETLRIRDDLQNFINATEFPVLFVDRELRLMRYTPFARNVFNVRPADLGRPLPEITNRLIDEDIGRHVRTLFETLAVTEREVRGIDGRCYMLRVLPYRTADDRIVGAMITFIDVTTRRVAEEAVRRNEAWLRLMLDSVRDYAILTLDPKGTIMSWNRAAESIFGIDAATAIGRNFEMIFVPEDRAAGTPQNELRAAREAGRADDERWQLRGDGSRFYASCVTAPLLEASEHGYVKILRDLTEERMVAQRRDEQFESERVNRAEAEQASKIKDEFIAMLSHELRNPLALIQLQAELLLRSPETRHAPRLANAAGIIHQTVKAQAQLVDDMLDVSRARTGKLAMERQLVPLPLIVADSIGALRQQAEAENITLSVEIDPQPMIVEADAVRIKQIAWNLLSNALKFTPHGGHVWVRLVREGREARLDVEDDGQGIDAEALPHIFEWFRQAETGSTRRKGGLGIGLALVKQLVELHGGRVEGFSAGPGRGARFSVWLPLQSAESGPRPVDQAQPTEYASRRLGGVRVLVIDDAPANAEAMRELLTLEDADVAVETLAHDAIRRAKAERFDVIISDLALPEMDGYTILREIRAAGTNRDTPAIAHSGYGGPDELARSKAAGFALHVTKPVDLDELVEAIATLGRRARPLKTAGTAGKPPTG